MGQADVADMRDVAGPERARQTVTPGQGGKGEVTRPLERVGRVRAGLALGPQSFFTTRRLLGAAPPATCAIVAGKASARFNPRIWQLSRRLGPWFV